MSEANRAPRHWNLPWGLIGMIPLVWLAESCVAHHEYALLNDPIILSWRVGGEAAGREAKTAEILCLGDSLVRLGLMPRILEGRLKKSALNLASPGAPASSSYFLLRRALGTGARPQALVVDFHSNVLTNPPRTTRHLWPEILTIGEAFELSWHARDLPFLLSTALALGLSSYRRREGLREEVRAALRGEIRPSRALMAANLRNVRVNRGASPQAKRTPIPDDSAPSETRISWKPYEVNAHYVERFLQLASSHRIAVYWLLPPLSPARQNRLERRGVDEGMMRFVHSMHQRYDNVVLIDGRHADYPANVFIDATHLDKQGAAELTTAVATVLEKGFAQPGSLPPLVTLPPFRGQTAEFPLEDLEQSIAVVRTNGERLKW